MLSAKTIISCFITLGSEQIKTNDIKHVIYLALEVLVGVAGPDSTGVCTLP